MPATPPPSGPLPSRSPRRTATADQARVDEPGPTPAPVLRAAIPAQPVHVLQIHGTSDSIARYAGGTLKGLPHPGAEESSQRWAQQNGCDTEPGREELAPRLDLEAAVPGAETVRSRWTGCPEGAEVELWTTLGAEHAYNEVASGASTASAVSVIDWLFAHPKS